MPTARVFRVKKRTIMDIHATAIRPRIVATMNQLGQTIVYDAQRHHEYKDRTGALTASLAWSFPEYNGRQFTMVVAAGGWSRAKYSMDYGRRKQTGVKRRNVRYQRGQRFNPRGGTMTVDTPQGKMRLANQGLYVNYARFVERKGYDVLTKSVERGRAKGSRIFGEGLKLRGVA